MIMFSLFPFLPPWHRLSVFFHLSFPFFFSSVLLSILSLSYTTPASLTVLRLVSCPLFSLSLFFFLLHLSLSSLSISNLFPYHISNHCKWVCVCVRVCVCLCMCVRLCACNKWHVCFYIDPIDRLGLINFSVCVYISIITFLSGNKNSLSKVWDQQIDILFLYPPCLHNYSLINSPKDC